VICIGRYNPDINDILAAIDPDKINHAYKIAFENASDAVFAFDPANPVYNSNMLFQKPYLLEGSPDYPLRWKFMTTGSGMDKVVAKMPAGIEQNKETLKFVVTSNNTEVDYTPGAAGSDIELNLMPATTEEGYAIHAVVKVGDKWEQAGRLDVFTRTPKNYSVTLVPMGGSVPVATDVKAALDGIWSHYGITWTVDVDDLFYIDNAEIKRKTLIDVIIGEGKLESGDGLFSEYTPKQKRINIAFRNYILEQNKYNNETMYVFVLPADKAPEIPNAPDILKLGDMPLGKQWGYLFGNADARTLAHELGHGKTKLQHTFKGDLITQGSTKNLLDYSDGTDLVRSQWEYIHDPAVFDPIQDDEDAADTEESVYVKSIFDDILCAKRNGLSTIDVSGYDKLMTGAYWTSYFPDNNYFGVFNVILIYGSSSAKSILNFSSISQNDNEVIIGNDECKLKITIRRNLNPSTIDAQKLVTYLNVSSDEINSNVEKILTSLDVLSGSAFPIALKKVPLCYFNGLNKKRRADYIEKLVDSKDSYFYLIERLIETCPTTPSEINDFFTELSTKNSFKKILLGSSSWSSRDNYNALNKDLVMLFYKQSKSTIVINPDHTLLWNKGIKPIDYLCSFDNNGDLEFAGAQYYYDNYGVKQPFVEGYLRIIYVDPFENIFVDFYSSLSYVGVIGVLPMPAFMFNWICNEYDLRILNTTIDISKFSLSFVFGIAEIANANKAWKIIVGVFELLQESGDLYFKLKPETRSIIEIEFEHGKEFLAVWDAVDNLLDIKEIREEVLNSNFPLLLSFEKAWEQMKNENSNLSELIGQIEFNKFENTYTLVK
jgi:hypothetical protein